MSLNVIVVGAGLGGLAAAIGIQRAGHKVTVLEQSSQFHHVGAGIQIPPNAARILASWDLIPAIAAHSVNPSDVRFRRWENGDVVHASSLQVKDRFGEEFYYIHRADFHSVLVEAARKLGVVFRLGAGVEDIDFDAPSVKLKSGEIVPGDVVIGADGLNSVCKEILLGHKVPPHPTGDLAYRLTVRADDMKQHPILDEIIRDITNDIWMGPDKFVVGYLLKEGGYYNIVLVSPDNLPDAVDVSKATPEEMRELLKGWDPRLQTLLDLVEQTQKWRMLTSEEMQHWGHEAGTFVLLGDACHASLPYLAQGAAMAIEDGAVLGALFAKVTSASSSHLQLKEILHLYEKLRKPRTTQIVQGSIEQGIQCKFHDGEEQQERDRLLSVPWAQAREYPIKFCDPGFREFLLGWDCEGEVERAWVGRGV